MEPDQMKLEMEYYRAEITKLSPDLSPNQVEEAVSNLIKQRFVKGKQGEWKPRDNVASQIGMEDFFNLMTKKEKMPEKPEFDDFRLAALEKFKQFPFNFVMTGAMEIVEEVSSPALFNYIKTGSTKMVNSKPNDFVLLKSVLCTSLPFVNANGAAFTAEDMIEAVESGQLDRLQPAIVDWRHNFQVYGNTIGSEIIDTKVDAGAGIGDVAVKQIVAYSVFYAWLFPEQAKKVRKWGDKGILTFSMACGADEVEEMDNGRVRVLRRPKFVANSIIPPDGDPADANAKLISIAGKTEIPVYSNMPGLNCAWYINKDNSTNNINMGDNMEDTEKKEFERQIAELKTQNEALQKRLDAVEKSEDAKKVETLTAEVNDLKTQNQELATKNQELTDKIVALEAEIVTLKADKEKAGTDMIAANEKIKEFHKAEVARVNVERKAKIQEVVGEDEVKVNFWLDQYKAEVAEDGTIVDPKEKFELAVANMPVSSKVDRSKNLPPGQPPANKAFSNVISN